MTRLVDRLQSTSASDDLPHYAGDLSSSLVDSAETGRLLWLASAQDPPAKMHAGENPAPQLSDSKQSNGVANKLLTDASAPAIDRYEDQIRDIEKLPRPENGSDVFVGSSTFGRWSALEKEFRAFHAHDRAFGGSTIPEINHYFERLFNGYTPRDVVFYAGTNDIGELHHSGQQVFQNFKTFEHKFHKRFPGSNLVFVSISMAPSRQDRKADYEEANRLIKGYMDSKPHCLFVDVTRVMHEKGTDAVNDKLFLPDRLHMTEHGYELWEPIIRRALRSPVPVAPETKRGD